MKSKSLCLGALLIALSFVSQLANAQATLPLFPNPTATTDEGFDSGAYGPCKKRTVMGTDAEVLSWAMFGTTIALGLICVALASVLGVKATEAKRLQEEQANKPQSVYPSVRASGQPSSRLH